MIKAPLVLLPGLEGQIDFLIKNLDLTNKKVLVIGAGSDYIASKISRLSSQHVDIIVDDTASMLLTRLNLSGHKNISCSMMDFDSTNFEDNSFDVVYAQASISSPNRKKILNEIFRILKPESYLCSGELIKLKNEIPPFIKNILSVSNLSPLNISDLKKLYESLNYFFIAEVDLSHTLNLYFDKAKQSAEIAEKSFKENEKAFHKKLLNRFAHESNSFLKFGADKYLGFYSFIFKTRS